MDLSQYYNDMAELPIENIKDLVVHHAAIPLSNNPDIEDIHRIHQGNGWLCVGYHAFIKADGTIQYGRPMDSEGAQSYGHNHEGLGVCLAGYFHPPYNDKPTKEQLKSLPEVLKNWKGKIPQKVRIVGHRDYGGTACPGDNLYRLLEDIKKKVNSDTSQIPPVVTIPEDKTFKDIISKYSKKYNLSEKFIEAIIKQESSFNPKAVSSSGAKGLMQLMPSTFQDCLKKTCLPENSDPFNPEINISCGSYYFSWIRDQYFPGEKELKKEQYYILAVAYNAGLNSEPAKYALKLWKNKEW